MRRSARRSPRLFSGFSFLLFSVFFVYTQRAAASGLGDHVEPTAGESKGSIFRIQEANTASGGKVRQFITGSGTIFAVAWTGAAETELPGFLSSYYGSYHTSDLALPKRGGRVPYRRVDDGKIVVERWNTLRRVRGKAYVKALMPAGVTPETINAK